jgi:hypothetical protein
MSTNSLAQPGSNVTCSAVFGNMLKIASEPADESAFQEAVVGDYGFKC